MSIEFGRLLKQHRKEHKLSQSQLVEKLHELDYEHYSKSDVSKWEHGLTKPTPGAVELLEDILLPASNGRFLRAAGYPCDAELRQQSIASEEYEEQNPLIIETRRRHFEQICRLLLTWKNLIQARSDVVKPSGWYKIEGESHNRKLKCYIEEDILFKETWRSHLPQNLKDDYNLWKRLAAKDWAHEISGPDSPEYKSWKEFQNLEESLCEIIQALIYKGTFQGKCKLCP